MYSAADVAGGLAMSVVERNRDVASQAVYLGAAHRAAAKRVRQLIVVAPSQRPHVDPIPGRTRLPRWIIRAGGHGVPRTDFLTDVASVDVRCESRAQLAGNIAAMFNRQVGDALR